MFIFVYFSICSKFENFCSFFFLFVHFAVEDKCVLNNLYRESELKSFLGECLPALAAKLRLHGGNEMKILFSESSLRVHVAFNFASFSLALNWSRNEGDNVRRGTVFYSDICASCLKTLRYRFMKKRYSNANFSQSFARD